MRSPAALALPFLEPEYVAQAGHEVDLMDDMIRELIAFAARLALDEDVVTFFWYCHHRMLHDPTLPLGWDEPWPLLDNYLGQDAGLLNVLLMLSLVPEMRNTYRRLGIPPDIARDTVVDLRRCMETDVYYQRYRRWGIMPETARWLSRHWQGRLFHLKRLQFEPSKFDGGLHAYRRRGGRELLAISEPGIRYGADGKAWGTCCGDDPGAWTSTLDVMGDTIIGNLIDSTGSAHREIQRLSLDEWELALSPGDILLSFHIPTGGSMDFEDCGVSFRQALEFFPHYFPELQFRGFSTDTWLLDPQLDTLLYPEANIVRLQRELYLFPGMQCENREVLQRGFGSSVTDITSVPWQTSLQKSVGQFISNGGHFHGGCGFLLKDDFCWGSQVYRQTQAWMQRFICDHKSINSTRSSK